jgi:Dynamin family
MPASELIERVAQLISTSLERFPAETQAELNALEGRLREPLRIAITGRVKAGKSTLVNALLGQRVAPTDVSECTRVVTWFSYGHPERLVIRLRDGSEIESQLTEDGKLPQELPVPVEQVASLHAYLANSGLRDMTLIDTPGLGSVHDEYSRATRELLASDSTGATMAADAVVFILGSAMMADEFKTLKLFQDPDGDGQASAANAVGVLGRADQLSDGTRDSWEVAVELAGRYAGTFGGEVATVVPVAGLIAETAEAALLTERDVGTLRALVELDPKAFDRLLWSADRFVSAEVPGASAETRERLLGMLDLYGISVAVKAFREGVSGATALRRELTNASGIGAVKNTLTTHFREQDHVLKVRSALEVLRRLSFSEHGQASPQALASLRSDVEALRLDPVMHPIDELEALHSVNTGQVQLSDELAQDMRRLFTPSGAQTRLGAAAGDPQALRDAARAGIARWRTFMLKATPAQAHVCRVVVRSYQLLWKAAG